MIFKFWWKCYDKNEYSQRRNGKIFLYDLYLWFLTVLFKLVHLPWSICLSFKSGISGFDEKWAYDWWGQYKLGYKFVSDGSVSNENGPVS